MKLSELAGDKIDIFLQRANHVAELPTKLQWAGFYGTPEKSKTAKALIKKLYKQDFKSKGRVNPAKMGEILRVRNVWRDINESWFLRDLNRIIPRQWRTGADPQGAQILATIQREQGPGDDSGLQHAIVLAVAKLAPSDPKGISDLLAKHILPELYA